MKKTDLYKNLALATAQRMKNATKVPKPGAAEDVAKSKKELATSNPLLASLIGKTESKSKKSIKKEQKKRALLEAGGDNSGSADDKAAMEASSPGPD